MKPQVGDEFRHRFRFTQEDVIKFAEVSGDNNPIHLDAEYAAQTPFKRPIIHGHLSSSVFTRFLGTGIPGGPGSVYIKQVTEYKRPMFVDNEYEVVFRIVSIDEKRHIAEIATEIFDTTTKKVTITGIGTLMNTTLY
ncbi:MAG: MaoC family dehydratase [Spirosomaceae bacterium]|jgi:acyl dehydratase|nr:MaoC family dehydratase [Spirosomataceae bacterium]